MTRTGPSKSTGALYAAGRLRKARARHHAAAAAEDPEIRALLAIQSAIAYADALTAIFGGRISQSDHAAATKQLRDILRDGLPSAQERNLARLLSRKAQVEYGSHATRNEEADTLITALDAFAVWARAKLAERGVDMAETG